MPVKLKALKKFPGVYYAESATRRWKEKPDRTYYIRFKDAEGKDVKIRIGRLSEGVTPEYCYNVLKDKKAEYLDKRYKTRKERWREQLTFAEFMEIHYLPWAMGNKKSYRDDIARYRKWLKDSIGRLRLSNIHPFHLEKVKKDLQDAGRSPATIKQVLALVRQAFNKASAWGFYSGDNPVSKVKMPTLNNQRVRFLKVEEAKALLEELAKVSPQTHNEALLSLHCGLRFGEIAALRWSDIDLENGVIHIKEPKSGASRYAYMTPQVKQMFERIMPLDPDPSALVFPSRTGEQKRSVSGTFQKVVEKLGLNDGVTDPRDRVCFHTLRHTCASWLAIRGTPLHVIKEILGHKTLAMTERYSHLLPDHKKVAIEGLGATFEEAGSLADEAKGGMSNGS